MGAKPPAVNASSDAPLPPSGGRRTVVDASSSPHLADLTLPALRTYREGLRAEEERASYWRRLVHARVDLIESGALSEAVVDVDTLARVLGDTGSGTGRAALHRVRAADPLPDLPDLVQVWTVPDGPEARAEVLAELGDAEEQLTRYRRALFDRIDEATAELIVRYRAQPTAALDVLV